MEENSFKSILTFSNFKWSCLESGYLTLISDALCGSILVLDIKNFSFTRFLCEEKEIAAAYPNNDFTQISIISQRKEQLEQLKVVLLDSKTCKVQSFFQLQLGDDEKLEKGG